MLSATGSSATEAGPGARSTGLSTLNLDEDPTGSDHRLSTMMHVAFFRCSCIHTAALSSKTLLGNAGFLGWTGHGGRLGAVDAAPTPIDLVVAKKFLLGRANENEGDKQCLVFDTHQLLQTNLGGTRLANDESRCHRATAEQLAVRVRHQLLAAEPLPRRSRLQNGCGTVLPSVMPQLSLCLSLLVGGFSAE